jgi:hypothetical protein
MTTKARRRVYWIEIHGGQLLSGPKLVQSCSVYEEEEEASQAPITRYFAGYQF